MKMRSGQARHEHEHSLRQELSSKRSNEPMGELRRPLHLVVVQFGIAGSVATRFHEQIARPALRCLPRLLDGG